MALGLGTLIPKIWDRWFPSKAEKAQEKSIKAKSESDLTSTLVSAIDIRDQLNARIDEKVEEKTQVLQNIFIRREGEYHVQIADYSRRIYEGLEREKLYQIEITKVRAESVELQKQILDSYRDLTDERRLKEQYFEELKEAKEHIVELEKRVGELERKNDNEKNISNR